MAAKTTKEEREELISVLKVSIVADIAPAFKRKDVPKLLALIREVESLENVKKEYEQFTIEKEALIYSLGDEKREAERWHKKFISKQAEANFYENRCIELSGSIMSLKMQLDEKEKRNES